MNDSNMLATGKSLLKLRRTDLFNMLDDYIDANLNTKDFKQTIKQEINRLEELEENKWGIVNYNNRELLSHLKEILKTFDSKADENQEILYENLFMIINNPCIKLEKNQKLYKAIERAYECYKEYINIVVSEDGKTLFLQNETRKDKRREAIMPTLTELPAAHYSSRDTMLDQFKDYVYAIFVIDTDVASLQWIDILTDEIKSEKLGIDEFEINQYYDKSVNMIEIYFPQYINKEKLDSIIKITGMFLKSKKVGIFSVYTN